MTQDSFYVGVKDGGEVITLDFHKDGETFEVALGFESAAKLSDILSEAIEAARRLQDIGEV